ncbi:hypothetical protein ACVI1L_003548 [Bradyrhizobium sp. USDA 4516]
MGRTYKQLSLLSQGRQRKMHHDRNSLVYCVS